MNRPRAALLRRRGDAGQVTAFVVVMVTALLLLAGLVLDGGLALAAKTRALTLAQAAARTGAQQLDLTAYRVNGTVRLDVTAAEQAARDYLAGAGADGGAVSSTVTATSTSVAVTVRARHRTQILSLIGIDALDVTAKATARPRYGVSDSDIEAEDTEPHDPAGPP